MTEHIKKFPEENFSISKSNDFKIKIISKKEFEKGNKSTTQEIVWDNISECWKEFRQRKIPIVEEFLLDKKGKVIDLGCGSGRNMIKNEDIEYYGVDISSKQLENAKEYVKDNEINAVLIKGSADELDKNLFKDEMFDYGLFIATLHCIESKKKRENALKEFYRVLKKGSESIITVWNSKDARFDGVKNKGDIYMSWRKDGTFYMRYYYLYEKEELIILLEKIGFKIVEIYTPREKDRFSRKNLIIRVKK